MSDIPKAYEPQAVEEKWYKFWLEQNCFTANPHSAKPAFSIVIPPPNVTGVLTLGHVLNNTIQDILSRKARMDGKEVLWLPGTDHAGIATENVVARQLSKEEKKSKRDLGRDEFIKRVWAWKEKHGGIIIQQLKKLGASCDWTRERFTMDPEYVRNVQRVFVDLFKKGKIYRGKRMVNWCPASLTALSDEEVVMKEQKGFLYYFKVEIAEEPRSFLTIATTRPETIPGDSAVAVNPKDPRYAKYIGKHVLRPLPAEFPRERKLIPVIGDEHVDFEFGTGVLKVTPAHDKADFEIGLRHKLPQIDIMHPNGVMNELAGADLNGLDRFKARKVAVEKLDALGALVKEEPYTNNVGFSERADVPIEPRLSEQWFLKYPSDKKARKCVQQNLEQEVPIVEATGKEFTADSIRGLRKAAAEFARKNGFIGKVFKNENSGIEIRIGRQSLSHAFSNFGVPNIQAVAVLPDLIRRAIWISSRPHEPANPIFKNVHRFVAALRLNSEIHKVSIIAKEFWDGTVLYDHKVNKTALGGKSLEAHPREGKLDTQPAPSAVVKLGDLAPEVNDGRMNFYPERWAKVYDHWMDNIQDWCISRQLWWGHRIPVWYRGTEIYCGLDAPTGEGWTQDPDVLDTWFSSWLWPFATMGWPAKTDTLKKFYPTTDLVTGPDIIFFWVARMIMAGYQFMGEMPFRNVYFTGIIRDKQGRKMSKSLGNSPDPLDLIAKYGADALRFGVMRAAPLGQDVLYDEQQVELGRNFCNKLWNACRFRQMQGGEIQGEINPQLLTTDDKWILLKLDDVIRELDAAFAEYKFSDATAALYRFFWGEYCDWYVESTKAVFFGSNAALKANTLAVIDFVLSHALRLFHPFLPFVTEELWHGMGYSADMPEGQGGRTIMYAPWPKPLDEGVKNYYCLSEEIQRAMSQRQKLVIEIRNMRAQYGIAANKKLKLVYHAAEPLPAQEAEAIKILANAEALEQCASYQPAKGEPVIYPGFGGKIYVPLAGLVDVEAEKARLTRELAKAKAEIEKVQQKLANPAFAEKVPPAVLEEHQQRLLDWESKHTQLQTALDSLGV